MDDSRHTLAIDLGTSSIKVALLSESLRPRGSSTSSYPTMSNQQGASRQRPGDWLDAARRGVAEVLANAGGVGVDSIVLTGQLPTLVALSASHEAIGDAVTWQDSRADDMVTRLLSSDDRQHILAIAGTPIDGRYLIPMHLLRRQENDDYRPTKLLSAKDYLYFVLTGRLVTDPSTASGYGNYSLAARGWDDELTELWRVSHDLMPDVVEPTYEAPLSPGGASLLDGVPAGTPVVLGAADSVCAHHYVTTVFPHAVSVIDGSSTVITTFIEDRTSVPASTLVTPGADPTRLVAELDLMSTGSSVAWLSALLRVAPTELEHLALHHPRPVASDLTFSPFLTGGEQGVLWRNDLRATLSGLRLSTTAADLALALFEGIAFESLRCLRALPVHSPRVIVSVANEKSAHLGAALLGALAGERVVAISEQSPALLGAALLALSRFDGEQLPITFGEPAMAIPTLGDSYARALATKAKRYFDANPMITTPPATN